MDKFNWGPSFININLDLLEAYSACQNSLEVVAIQEAHIAKCEAEQAAKASQNPNERYNLPPSDDEEEESEEEDEEDEDNSFFKKKNSSRPPRRYGLPPSDSEEDVEEE